MLQKIEREEARLLGLLPPAQQLVESYRTVNGPRQRIVAYLGQLKESTRKGVKQSAEGKSKGKPQFIQAKLFKDTQQLDDQLVNGQINRQLNDQLEPEWVEINASGVRVENEKAFGGPWLAMQLIKLLGLDEFLHQQLPPGEEHVAWSLVSLILVICRLLNPSSELHIAEHFYKSTALADLLGVPDDRVNDDRLYRREKEKAMHERFVARMEKELEKVRASCEKCKCKKEVIDRRIGRIKSQNSRGAGLFDIKVEERDGRAMIAWTKRESWQDWATLSEGCYLLRTNVTEWSPEDFKAVFGIGLEFYHSRWSLLCWYCVTKPIPNTLSGVLTCN